MCSLRKLACCSAKKILEPKIHGDSPILPIQGEVKLPLFMMTATGNDLLSTHCMHKGRSTHVQNDHVE